jgi:Maltose acetyltransferase
MRSEKDKMLAGELYDASAPEIQAELAATHRWLARYNAHSIWPPPTGTPYCGNASRPLGTMQ